MKKISKIISLLLALVCVISVIPMSAVSANAASTPTFTLVPSTTSAKVGDTISVDVVVTKNSKLCSLVADVFYDSKDFKVLEVVAAGAFGGSEVVNKDYSSDAVRFVGTTTTYIDDNTTKLFTVKFKVLRTCGEIYMLFNEAYVANSGTGSTDVTFNANMALKSIEIHDYKNLVCAGCGQKTAKVTIQTPSRTTIRCKDGIVLHAKVEGDVSGATVKWTSDNNKFKKTISGNDITIISNSDGYTVFTASVYDADGNLLSSDSVTMRSKASFFDMLGGFFRSLFGSTIIYEK